VLPGAITSRLPGMSREQAADVTAMLRIIRAVVGDIGAGDAEHQRTA
jgi:hypothetical protein